jgi:hypothetical protein
MSGDSPSKLSRKGLNMKQNLADSYLVGKNLSKRKTEYTKETGVITGLEKMK